MILESLRLRNFRNLEALEISPDRRFNVIAGKNGQGKTNLLEAIHLLATLKSFRAFKNQHLIRHGEQGASCAAAVDRGGHRRDVEITVGPRGRRVSVNGATLRRLTDFFGTINTVAFCPEDIYVFRGAKPNRRLVLDRMIFNAQPLYASEVSDYEDTLRQRNAVIKDGHVGDPGLLAVYDEQLVELGSRVIMRRATYVDLVRGPLGSAFAEIYGPGFDVDLRYVPGVSVAPSDRSPGPLEAVLEVEALRDAYRDALLRCRSSDLTRGFTTVGPHRDDLAGTIGGQPLRDFASQGQQRAFVLALKISEIKLLREELGHYPVLLLDDVSSELDPSRNRMLFDFLSGIDGQVFITTTDADFIRLSHPFTRWDVMEGRIREVGADR